MSLSRHEKPVNLRASNNGQPETPDSFDPAALEAENPRPPSAACNPFDPEALRLSADFAASLGVKKALLSVPVRRPDRSWFVRTHPLDAYTLQTAVIELKEDREIYLVAKGLWTELATESTFSPRALFTAINRQGVVFLWPVRLPGADGKLDSWSQSALEATKLARKSWVRVAANMSLGGYDVFTASAELADPEWPAKSFDELLALAFKQNYISDLNHPVLQKLRGEV
jgi:hypothetical protein